MSWNTPERRVVFAGPPGWSHLPNVTRALLVLTGAGYLAGLFAPSRMRLLAVFPELVWPALELWRLVTYPMAVIGIFNVLFGLLVLWMFGWELESVFGSRRFGLFVLSSVVASAVLGCGVALLFPRAGAMAGAGLSGLLTAMIVAWALLGPGLPANLFGILPMTRKGFALLALVLSSSASWSRPARSPSSSSFSAASRSRGSSRGPRDAEAEEASAPSAAAGIPSDDADSRWSRIEAGGSTRPERVRHGPESV